MGHYFCTRDGKELESVKWDQIIFANYESGPDKEKGYVQLNPDEDKINKSTLNTPSLNTKERKKKLRETPEYLLYPYKFISLFQSEYISISNIDILALGVINCP